MIEKSIKALRESNSGKSLLSGAGTSGGAHFAPFNRCIVLRTNAWKQFAAAPTPTTAVAVTTAAAAAHTSAAASADTKSTSKAAAAPVAVSFSSRDPPYLTVEAAQFLVDTFGLCHLCVDLPSVGP
jgi:hypothetical protein